ncbi:hypothetical protein D3C86_1142070 [compost metagenome]
MAGNDSEEIETLRCDVIRQEGLELILQFLCLDMNAFAKPLSTGKYQVMNADSIRLATRRQSPSIQLFDANVAGDPCEQRPIYGSTGSPLEHGQLETQHVQVLGQDAVRDRPPTLIGSAGDVVTGTDNWLPALWPDANLIKQTKHQRMTLYSCYDMLQDVVRTLCGHAC